MPAAKTSSSSSSSRHHRSHHHGKHRDRRSSRTGSPRPEGDDSNSSRDRSSRHHSSSSKRDYNLDHVSFQSYDFIKKSSKPFEESYELGQLLGEGGFGACYVCTHIKTGEQRACKILPKSETDLEANKEAYEEFRMMAHMDHPNIAKTYELYKDQDSFYIVQDLYKGGDLFDLVEKGTLSEFDTAMVINSLLMSIGYFHHRKLCHRDLKPENVLLEDSNDYTTAKIIDFGLARYEKENGKKFTDILGSLEYVSPQVLHGSYGKSCDIWSVGVIAFVLLAGRPPFYGDDDPQIMESIKRGQYEFSDEIWRTTISDDCKDFIGKLLEYEEDDRPTAEQALGHKWLVEMRKKYMKDNHDLLQTRIREAVFALERFRSRRSKLKQATCALLSAQFITKRDRDQIDPVFRVLDRTCSGEISVEDLHYAFWFTDFTGEERTDEQVERIVKETSFSGSREVITYSEFAAAMMLETNLVENKRLQDMFDYFDVTSKGDIDRVDLEEVLFPEGGKHAEDSCRRIIAQATDDRSKHISFKTFKKAVLPASPTQQ